MKELDKTKKVFDLCTENEGLREFLVENGFSPLANDLMFKTSGRMVSLETGLKNHDVNLDELNKKLEKIGYKVV